MSEEIVSKAQTRLARFIERKWRVSGESQADFVKSLMKIEDISDFGAQTLSKYIRGRLAAPPAGLIEALANKFDIPIADLEDMAVTSERTPVSRDRISIGTLPELHFLMGNTVWAASFVLAFSDKDARSFDDRIKIDFASRFVTGPDADLDDLDLFSGGELDWYHATVAARQDPSHHLVPLSAPTIIELLESPEHQNETSEAVVTFGILPWKMVEERQRARRCEGRYVRLATLMDCTAASSVIVPAVNTISTDGQAANNTLAMGALIRWLAREHEKDTPSRRIVLGEQGSVAGEQARRIAQSAQALFNASQDKGRIAILFEDCSTTDLDRLNWKELEDRYGAVEAIIAWDPQATGVVKRSEGSGKPAARYSLIDTLGERGSDSFGGQSGPGHTTLDVVLFLNDMPNDPPDKAVWRENVAAAAECLFYEIMPIIERRQAALLNLGSNRQEREILKKHYGFDAAGPPLSSEEVERAFSNIRYVAAIDPAGLCEMRNLAFPPSTERF